MNQLNLFDEAEMNSLEMPACHLCKLDQQCQSPKMPVYGRGTNKILLVGEAPGASEDALGRPFVGESGQLLKDNLSDVGIDIDDCWRTNAVICFVSSKVLVYTSQGYKQMRHVAVGDLVLTHRGRFRKVLSRSMDRPLSERLIETDLVDIKIGTVKLTVTADHLFLTRNGWTRADQISMSDCVRVLGEKCIVCGDIYFKNPSRFDQAESTCSQKCHNIMASRKSGKAISESMKRQYQEGRRDPQQITEAAHQKVRTLVEEGNWNPRRYVSEESKNRGYEKSAKNRQGFGEICADDFYIGIGEREVADYLRSEEIEFISQFAIGHCNVDFYLPEFDLVIEVENVRKFNLLKKYKPDYYLKREKLVSGIGARLIFLQTEDPVAELKRILRNDRHDFHFTWHEISFVKTRTPSWPKYRYCLEVEEDSSYISKGIVSHNCRPPSNKLPTKAVGHCRPNLLQTLRELKPEVVVLLGAAPIQSLIGRLYKESPGAVGRWVGWQIPCREFNCWVCPTYHPAYLLRNRHDEALALWFKRHLDAVRNVSGVPYPNGYDLTQNLVERLYSQSEAISAICYFEGLGKPIAFDLETDRLKPDHPKSRIVCASMSDGERAVAFPWHGKIIKAFRAFCRSNVPKVAANLSFEDRWMRAQGFQIKNWVWDTVQAAHVLDNRSGITSLKFQAFVRFGIGDYSSHIEPYLETAGGGNVPNRIDKIDLDSLLMYCGFDSLLTARIAKQQMEEL